MGMILYDVGGTLRNRGRAGSNASLGSFFAGRGAGVGRAVNVGP
jgi:hypothetical protein